MKPPTIRSRVSSVSFSLRLGMGPRQPQAHGIGPRENCYRFFNSLSSIHCSYICVLPHRCCCQDFYHDSSLFTSPLLMLEHVMTGIVRERERERAHGRGTQEGWSIFNFGRVRVLNPAAGMAGECFIHCTVPFRHQDKIPHLQFNSTFIVKMCFLFLRY